MANLNRPINRKRGFQRTTITHNGQEMQIDKAYEPFYRVMEVLSLAPGAQRHGKWDDLVSEIVHKTR